MNIAKIFWAARAVVYKPFTGKVGKLSYIGKPIIWEHQKNIIIGNKVRIFPGSRMECIGKGRIIIEDDVSIGQNCHIISENSDLVIGTKSTIASNVFITNTDHNYKDIGVHIMKQDRIPKKTSIGENCFIGYGVAIEAGTTLGKQCIVGSNAVVRGNFPDYCVIGGVPARILKRYNQHSKEWEREA